MKIGIALGSGSARGWAHLGVLKSLKKLNITPHVVTGASAGALVGGAYASNRMIELERWARDLTRTDIWRLLDATLGSKGGIIKGDRLMRAIAELIPDQNIQALTIPFASVAADLATGREVWFQSGSLHRAIRASSGFPGLFAPIRDNDRWLIDGGVVNPVPVSLCRVLGADFVIAVNLNQHLDQALKNIEKNKPSQSIALPDKNLDTNLISEAGRKETLQKWSDMLNNFMTSRREERQKEPSMIDVMTASINIMQNRITRSRMVGDPPDATITPNLSGFQMLDFHRAEEAIEEGAKAVTRSLEELQPIIS